nr:PREDICTED: uncharacterized protein LOC109034058 isoform X2 [Bemisia tabaci]
MQMSLQKTRHKLRKWRRIWALLLTGAVVVSLWLIFRRRRPPGDVLERLRFLPNPFAASGLTNETGAPTPIVPNLVHFIVFQKPTVSFIHFVCVLAALRNQRPDKIYFHSNVQLSGPYWERLLKLKEFSERVVLRQIEMPKEIFNQTIREDYRIFHGGDIARIQVLMQFGGIFLDNDSYVVKSLDFFRHFEMAIGWDEEQFLGTQIIVAHREARFLDLWLHSYEGMYETDLWYYNAGELPTTWILHRRPDLVHRVKVLFGNDGKFQQLLFQRYWPGWREQYTFHLLARKAHQSGLRNISPNASYPVDFNEHNLQNYPITFREMANEVLDYEKILLKEDLALGQESS